MQNNQVENTVLIELFSHFFNKLIKDHPNKKTLEFDLEKLRNSLFNKVGILSRMISKKFKHYKK